MCIHCVIYTTLTKTFGECQYLRCSRDVGYFLYFYSMLLFCFFPLLSNQHLCYAAITTPRRHATSECMRPLLLRLRNCCITRPETHPPWLSEEIHPVHLVMLLQFFAYDLVLFYFTTE